MSGDRFALGAVMVLVFAGWARRGSRGLARGSRVWREAPDDWPLEGQRIRIAAGAMHLLGLTELTLPELTGLVLGIEDHDGSDGFLQILADDVNKVPLETRAFNRREGIDESVVEVHAPFRWLVS